MFVLGAFLSGLLKERNAEVGKLMGENASLEREIEKLREEVCCVCVMYICM